MQTRLKNDWPAGIGAEMDEATDENRTNAGFLTAMCVHNVSTGSRNPGRLPR